MYEAVCLSSPERAEKWFAKNGDPAVAVVDFGFGADAVDLVSSLSYVVPFIAVGTRTMFRTSYLAATAGAVDAIEMPFDMSRNVLSDAVNRAFLYNLAAPPGSRLRNETIHSAADIALKAKPCYVDLWADRVGISTQQLRRLISRHLGMNPRHLLFFLDLFQDAFRCSRRKKVNGCSTPCATVASEKYDTQQAYYLKKKKFFADYQRMSKNVSLVEKNSKSNI